jgi:hypothetical protein
VLTPGNLVLSLLYGNGADANGVTICSSAAIALIASQTNLSWMAEFFVHCRSIGSTRNAVRHRLRQVQPGGDRIDQPAHPDPGLGPGSVGVVRPDRRARLVAAGEPLRLDRRDDAASRPRSDRDELMPPILFKLQDARGSGVGPLIPAARPDLNINLNYLSAISALAFGSNDTLSVLRGVAGSAATAITDAATIGAQRGVAGSSALRLASSAVVARLAGVAGSAMLRLAGSAAAAVLRGVASAARIAFGQSAQAGAARGMNASAGMVVASTAAIARARGFAASASLGFACAVLIGARRGFGGSAAFAFAGTLDLRSPVPASRTVTPEAHGMVLAPGGGGLTLTPPYYDRTVKPPRRET